MPPKRMTNGTTQDSDDDSSSSGSASDDSVATVINGANKRKATARKTTSPRPARGRGRGRPPKKQRVLDDSDDDTQPSTSSGITNSTRNKRTDTEEESDTGDEDYETPDSDYMPVDDNLQEKRKNKHKKRMAPARISPRKKTAPNYTKGVKPQQQLSATLNGSNSQKGTKGLTQLSKSLNYPRNTQGARDPTFDPKLVETLAHKCVYFLLIEDQKKHAIKRKAIVQHVFKDESYSPKLYTAVVLRAGSILMKTFGMELMELENQKDNYLIINVLRRELGVEEYIELSQSKHQQHGLILYLLTVIFMNGNSITEDELTKALKTIRIDLTSNKLHPIFGDVKRYITLELVKQMYLNYECTSKDPPSFEITWGLRAKQEFDKKDLLMFACQIMDDTTPESWILQYRDAEESAGPP